MKMKMLAALAAASLLSVQAVNASADYGYYDDGYSDNGYYDNGYYDNGYYDNGYYDDGYVYDDNTYTDDNTYADDNYNDSAEDYSGDNTLDDSSSKNPAENNPATITLEPTKITDQKFSAMLKIKTKSAITAADLTITYNPEVLKLTGNKINEKTEGTAVAAETEKGIFQYQFASTSGSEWEEEYITLDFEIIDPLERSTVLYINVNSLLNTSNQEITCVANGTVIQIEGAVSVDASMDESMFTELRVAKSSSVLTFGSLGLKDVKAVTVEDGELAAATESGIMTMACGITNMTVEFTDGTFKYYRLVISEPTAAETAPVETQVVVIDGKETVIQQVSPQTTPQGGVTKTETKSSKKVKYFIIYVVVLAAIVALFVEGFVILGNPYSKTAAILKNRRKNKADEGGFEEDDMFPESSEAYGETDDEEYDESEEYEESEEYDESEETAEEADGGYEDESDGQEETEDTEEVTE
ncbi:MAG: hypothetical protein ACI4JW_09580 [Oscillospiraceae bacterium]